MCFENEEKTYSFIIKQQHSGFGGFFKFFFILHGLSNEQRQSTFSSHVKLFII